MGRLFHGFLSALLLAVLVWPADSWALILVEAPEESSPPSLPGAEEVVPWVGELQHGATPGFLGTVIGPHHFLTAAHIDFAPGQNFFLQGQPYRITARTEVPGSDLVVGFVEGTFPGAVELLHRTDEPGRGVLVLGKGRWKGEAVRVGGQLKGWRYAETGTPGIRWGTNKITATVSVANPGPGEPAGEFLAADFDREAGAHEAHLTLGDSGAPVFIQDCGRWRLAGIGSTVDGLFARSADAAEDPFMAALMDVGGLFRVGAGETRRLLPETVQDAPSAWYAVRVSQYIDQLRALVGLPALPPAVPLPPAFAWVTNGISTELNLATLLGAETVQSLECVDAETRFGSAVAWAGGDEVVVSAPAADKSLDILRYSARQQGRQGPAGSIYLVNARHRTAVPQLLTVDGRVVVVWPSTADAVAAAFADDITGPWRPLDGGFRRLGEHVVFADETAHPSSRFYRLVVP